jgi:hypothetical protein
MSDNPRITAENRLADTPPCGGPTPERALKNFRYVVASVNESALAVWADLWRELQEGVTPGGMVTPQRDEGFKPSCGWAEFLEKFWLLKHYLDYIHRYCQ